MNQMINLQTILFQKTATLENRSQRAATPDFRMRKPFFAAMTAMFLSCTFPVSATELLNSSFDISRELFSTLNQQFLASWQQQHPQAPLTIKQSHAGSSKQALAILQGLQADVVTYNQVTDVQILHDRGQLLPADWQSRLPDHSSPFYSTMAFIVRKGNPKQIHNWNDLVRQDVALIFPNPKTSGNGRYTYLAAWGAQQQLNGQDSEKTQQWMKHFLKNVAVFDTGGRAATATFAERHLGDVLISFESEAQNIVKQYGADNYEIIVPPVNVLAEFPVAWVDSTVNKKGTLETAKAYLNYLYTPEARMTIVSYGYRVNDEKIMASTKSTFPTTQLFRVEERIGSWPEVMRAHFASGALFDQLVAAGRQ